MMEGTVLSHEDFLGFKNIDTMGQNRNRIGKDEQTLSSKNQPTSASSASSTLIPPDKLTCSSTSAHCDDGYYSLQQQLRHPDGASTSPYAAGVLHSHSIAGTEAEQKSLQLTSPSHHHGSGKKDYHYNSRHSDNNS